MTDTTVAPNGAAPTPAPQPHHDPAGAPAPPEGAEERMRTRSARAAEIRREHAYDGRLTLTLLAALAPLLEEPTPARYVTTTAPTPGKPYVSTGLNSTQYQVDCLNAVLGLAHWRYLLRYEEQGTLAHCFAIVGNRLHAVTVGRDSDELVVPDDAEILVVRDGWGGHQRGATKGDVLKGAETNAMKRTLARLGPGGDVYRLDVEADLHGHGPERRPEQPPAAGVDAEEFLATARQLEMLRAKARAQGLDAGALANALRRAAGVAPRAWTCDEEAQALLAEKLPRLPRRLVNALIGEIAAAGDGDTGAKRAPASDSPPDPAAAHKAPATDDRRDPGAAHEPAGEGGGDGHGEHGAARATPDELAAGPAEA